MRPGTPTVPGTQPAGAGHRESSRLPSRRGPFKASHRRSTRLNSACRRWDFRRDWAPPSRRRRSRENTGSSSNARSPRRTRSRWSSAGPRSSYCERSLVASTSPTKTWPVFKIVTDQEFAVVGKKTGRTVLDLWFPDPRDPNDQRKDRTLSYMVVVLPDPERAALDVLEERRRLEAQVKAFEQALKVLEREIKQAFPDSAVQLSLVGEQVVVRGESKDVVEAAQILRIVARTHADGEDAARSTPGASTWLLSPAWATSRRRSTPSANCWRETRTSSTSCACRANSRSCSWSRWPK